MKRANQLTLLLCIALTGSGRADQQVVYPPSAMPRVDIHTHMDAKTQYAKSVEIMDQWGGTISITLAGLFWVKDNDGNNASPASVRQIPSNDMVYVRDKLSDRILFAPGAFTIPSNGIWWNVNEIKTFKDQGFVGLKLWPHGAILSTKIPGIHEQLSEAGRQGMPLIGYHTGDPGDLKGNSAAFPKFEDDTIEVVKAHPQTTFIFAHGLFMLENDLGMEKLGRIFDKYPNVFVDTAFTHNMRQTANYTVSKARAFYIKYRDRILFGSDVFAAGGDANAFLNERRVLETNQVASGLHGGPKLEGLNLPADVLNHIYYWNAARLIPRVRQVLESRSFNIGFELGRFRFDRLPPDLTVNNVSFSRKPVDLTGTVNSVTNNLTVEVAGKVFRSTDNRDGTWKVPGTTLVGLRPGTYVVNVSAENSIGLVRTAVGELRVGDGEPADPDKYDMSVWKNVKSGIHSGFGSLDVADSRSLPPTQNPESTISLSGWKGERVNCKLLVWSPENEGTVSIKASKLTSEDNEIDSKNVSISVVRYVLTDEFPGGNDRRIKDRIPAHLKPDILSRESSFSTRGQETRPVWISVNIPSQTPAGIYNGMVTRTSARGIVNHSVTLEVQNQLLPSPTDWKFHLDLWQNPFSVARFHGVTLWSPQHFKLLQPLLTMLAQAGQKCITATLNDKPWDDQVFDSHGSMIKWTKKRDGTWNYDYAIFDKYVQLSMECGITQQINCYSMVPVGNKISWFDELTGKTVRRELIPGTPAYETIWRSFLTSFKAHLRNKAWLQKTTIALDEREQDEMNKMFGFLKETAPELKISMAGFYYKDLNPAIYDFSSNWHAVPSLMGDVMASRKRAGLKTTYYVACMIPRPNNFTFSPPAESCYEGWFASALGFDGFLRWAYNSWVEDPMVDSRYVTWPSGDCFFVYPGAKSSVRFERLREGIQDYEKIRILRQKLGTHPAKAKLDDFLASINSKTLDQRSAADVINEGKKLLRDASESLDGLKTEPKLMGNRFFTFSTIVRVRQIEISRDLAEGPDESSLHTPEEARTFREAIEKAWPGARITWGFSWLALKDQRPNYLELKKLIVSYHKKFGDEITFVPGGFFSNMYNTREQVNRDLHEGLKMVSELVGGGYRPKCVIAGFLSAENLQYLAEKEGIRVCQGNIWSQYAVDNGDGEGSISYPYYPSREHFCKPAQSKKDQIDCVNLDGWTVDFLCARYPVARTINGIRCGSRQGVGPIETLLRMGDEQGAKAILATTAAHFDTGFALNNFAWVTCIWEMGLVEGRKIYGYGGRNGMGGLNIWLNEMRRRWPAAKCVTQGEFGMIWRKQFKDNDKINYRFAQRGSGIGGSDAEMEIRWFMNKDFRLALLHNWQDGSPEKLIDFTRYDLPAREPADPTPGQHSRNWSLFNRLNQKGVRPQDAPIPIGQLTTAEQAFIKRRYPELLTRKLK